MVNLFIIIAIIGAFCFPCFLTDSIKSNSDDRKRKYKYLAGMTFALIVCVLCMLLNR